MLLFETNGHINTILEETCNHNMMCSWSWSINYLQRYTCNP